MSNNKRNWDEIEEKFSQKTGLPFSEALSQEDIKNVLEQENVAYRKRVFSPVIVIWAFLSQILEGDSSCRKSASRVLAFLVSEGKAIYSVSASAFCQAKQRLKTSVLAALVHKTGQETSALSNPEHLWHGRRVLTFDGSTLLLQDTEKNQAKYPKWCNQKASCGFPIARWAVLFCLSTGSVLEMYLEPMKVSERLMFRRFYKLFSPGDIALADRGGCSFYDMAMLILIGVDSVFRMHASRKINFDEGYILGDRDHIVAWYKPRFDKNYKSLTRVEYDNLPKRIWVREVEVSVEYPGFRTKKIIIATTLSDPISYPKQDLSDLYLRRWEAEIDLRHLKTTLKMEMFKSQTPEMFEKEVWAHLLVYNLIRRVMWQASIVHHVSPLRISFKGTIDRINAFLPYLSSTNSLSPKNLGLLFSVLLWNIASDLVPVRQGRIYERCLKRGKKPFPYMKKNRSQYRNYILENLLRET